MARVTFYIPKVGSSSGLFFECGKRRKKIWPHGLSRNHTKKDNNGSIVGKRLIEQWCMEMVGHGLPIMVSYRGSSYINKFINYYLSKLIYNLVWSCMWKYNVIILFSYIDNFISFTEFVYFYMIYTTFIESRLLQNQLGLYK